MDFPESADLKSMQTKTTGRVDGLLFQGKTEGNSIKQINFHAIAYMEHNSHSQREFFSVNTYLDRFDEADPRNFQRICPGGSKTWTIPFEI